MVHIVSSYISVIMDASPNCHKVSFSIGTFPVERFCFCFVLITRDINEIHFTAVTQYSCNNDPGGPHGCLQYFTGTAGRVSSFGFPTAEPNVISTSKSATYYIVYLLRALNF